MSSNASSLCVCVCVGSVDVDVCAAVPSRGEISPWKHLKEIKANFSGGACVRGTSPTSPEGDIRNIFYILDCSALIFE